MGGTILCKSLAISHGCLPSGVLITGNYTTLSFIESSSQLLERPESRSWPSVWSLPIGFLAFFSILPQVVAAIWWNGFWIVSPVRQVLLWLWVSLCTCCYFPYFVCFFKITHTVVVGCSILVGEPHCSQSMANNPVNQFPVFGDSFLLSLY